MFPPSMDYILYWTMDSQSLGLYQPGDYKGPIGIPNDWAGSPFNGQLSRIVSEAKGRLLVYINYISSI